MTKQWLAHVTKHYLEYLRAVWITENTLSVWSLRRTERSYRITILRLPDTAVQIYKLVWAGLVCTSCMHVCVGELICTAKQSFLATSLKIVNNKEKPSTTGKLNQWWKQRRLSTFIILNCTSLKSKKDTNKKFKRFLSKSKGCRVVKSTTGSQCKLTRNKHGMVTRLTC